MYQQRTQSDRSRNSNIEKLITGTLHIWILGAQNLSSQLSGNNFEAKINVSLRQINEQPQFNCLDIMNEDDYIACIDTIRDKKDTEAAIPYVKANGSQLEWNSQTGAYVNMGNYMKKFA